MMYKWLMRYIQQFDEDFPVASVRDYSEYEICRVIQECCDTGIKYTLPETPASPIVGVAQVGAATI
ncbi:MAG: hypothetical protein LKI17_06305 [Megasphaera cerevisiae]|jgi:hypothetical protein|nr:hypothetical protein [Megasphaera cerevisiae]